MGAARRAPATIGVVVLLLAVLAATTSGGMTWLGSPTSSTSQQTQEHQSGGGTAGTGTQGSGGEQSSPIPTASPPDVDWLHTLGRVVLAVVIGAVVLSVIASLRLVVRRRRLTGEGRSRSLAAAYDEAEQPSAEEELREVVNAQLGVLGGGSPRNAVVAAWVQLEDFAASHGLPRHPEDTPAEFVARALAAYDLEGSAIERLAELYREARFSQHPLTERHRDEARDCLEHLIHAGAAR